MIRTISAISAALMTATAAAQVTTVSEPVPVQIELSQIPVEYTDAGVMKAQHIKPGDISPEAYAALLAEADKVRAFNGARAGGSYVPATPSIDPSPKVAAGTVIGGGPATITVGSIARHSVVKGDTLYNISKRFGVSIAELKAANGMTDTAISLGQTLTIPGGTQTIVEPVAQPMSINTHTPPATTTYARIVEPVPTAVQSSGTYAVLAGDTLYSISRRACVKVGDITAANAMTDTNIKPGQKLTLPSGHCLN